MRGSNRFGPIRTVPGGIVRDHARTAGKKAGGTAGAIIGRMAKGAEITSKES